MVRELYGIQGPDIGAQTAHRKFGGTVAGMAKHNVRLNGEGCSSFSYHNPKKKKGVVSHALAVFFISSRPGSNFLTATQQGVAAKQAIAVGENIFRVGLFFRR
ncbi:hypothetical protein LNP20_06800 [Klebsiella pneumoniae subsp. pneumoniae]|nr:hypothetical protein [Klebsiella pneumoniae subsp. pneumoniae]